MLKPSLAAALIVIAAAPALADCPVNNRYTLSFPSFGAQQLNYATSYTTTVSNPRGQSLTMGLSFSTFNLSSNQVSGLTMPQISTFINDGGTTNNNLIIGGTFAGRTTDVSANTRTVVTRFTFSAPIHDFTIQVNDVDFLADQFRDWIQVNGINGASNYDPVMTTPFGTNNTTAGPHSAAGSSLLLGAVSSPLSLTVRQAGGTAANNNNANGGTFTAVFPAPVTEVDVRYGNFPLGSGETATGQQAIGIQSVSFCPMPQLTVTKSSAPYATGADDPNRFHIPDADMVYDIIVSNSDASMIELNALILTDVLPSAITFRNSDYDDGGPITTNFEFVPGSSGLTMASSDIAFSNNGGSSYGYAPAAGYDAAVNGIRLNPKGVMAANSSFTVRFRAKIK